MLALGGARPHEALDVRDRAQQPAQSPACCLLDAAAAQAMPAAAPAVAPALRATRCMRGTASRTRRLPRRVVAPRSRQAARCCHTLTTVVEEATLGSSVPWTENLGLGSDCSSPAACARCAAAVRAERRASTMGDQEPPPSPGNGSGVRLPAALSVSYFPERAVTPRDARATQASGGAPSPAAQAGDSGPPSLPSGSSGGGPSTPSPLLPPAAGGSAATEGLSGDATVQALDMEELNRLLETVKTERTARAAAEAARDAEAARATAEAARADEAERERDELRRAVARRTCVPCCIS
jgi:hypothetical protein